MSTLKEKTVSGVLWSFLERFGTMGISFITNLILARLLTADDYGTVGMLAIFIMLSNAFVEGGLGSALIQKQNPTQDDYSTVFLWNVLLSITLYFLLFVLSPYIAAFYNNQSLTAVLRVQAIILIPNAFSVIPANVLRKQLKFQVLARKYLFPAFLGAVISIIMASNGLGVWSLVGYQLVNSFVLSFVLWKDSSWSLSFHFSFRALRSLLSFGGFILLSSLLNTFMENIQGLLIGKFYSPATMGYYTQARKLQDIPATSLSSVTSQVTFPVFSQIQNDAEALSIAHHKVLCALNYIVIPLMVLLMVISEPLIMVLYSEKWINSIPLFRILCLSGIVNCMISVNYQLFVSAGNSRKMFRWNIIRHIIGLASILIGMHWGIKGMLYGIVLSSWTSAIINASLAQRISSYRCIDQVKDQLPVLLITLVSAGISLLIERILPSFQFIKLVCLSAVYVSSYILLSYVFKVESLFLCLSIIKSLLLKVRI